MNSQHTTTGKTPGHGGLHNGLCWMLPALMTIALAGCVHTSAGSTPLDTAASNAVAAASAGADLEFAGTYGLALNKADGSGRASYYGRRFAGNLTANGERFDPRKLTAAHRTLPFGTRVLVTNLDNGRHVTVRINDRGPFVASRIIDLSRGAAKRLGMLHSGTAEVRLQVLGGSPS